MSRHLRVLITQQMTDEHAREQAPKLRELAGTAIGGGEAWTVRARQNYGVQFIVVIEPSRVDSHGSMQMIAWATGRVAELLRATGWRYSGNPSVTTRYVQPPEAT